MSDDPRSDQRPRHQSQRCVAFLAHAIVLGLAAGLSVAPASVRAHEFWVDPAAGRMAVGDALAADLKVGQRLQGTSYPFISQHFARFDLIANGVTQAVTGLDGDLPALAPRAIEPGLNIIAHETVPFRVTYDDWSVFQFYLTEEGLDDFEQRHLARGLPATGFSERYTRHSKALVQAGPVRPGDRDRPIGMALEIVAEENPYRDGSEGVPLRLLWQGEPLAHWQISVIHAGTTEPTRRAIRTDAEGRAYLPLSSGDYLLNAVMLEPIEDAPAEDAPIVWSSHWASLVFELGP